jgi:hypothetical protein
MSKGENAIRAELERIEGALAQAKADLASRTTAGAIYPYWEKPLPDVSRLEGFRDALRWVLS